MAIRTEDVLKDAGIPDLVTWEFDDVASTITPEVAERLLSLNIDNRVVRSDAVARYADDMRNGRFLHTGATISIDTEGRILDGQHRLLACVESGVTIRSIIISGLEPEAFTATDKGTRRSMADTLKRMGYTNTARMAAATVAVMQWDEGYRSGEVIGGGRRVSEQRLLTYLTEHDEELAAAAGSPTVAAAKVLPKVSDTARVITRRVDPEDSEVFFEALRTGVTEEPGLILLREALRRDREGSGKSRGAFWQLGMILKTWNLWREGDLSGMKKAVIFTPGGSKANKLPAELS